MKKILDKLKSYLLLNKKLMLFLFILVLFGVGSGSVFTIFLNSDDKALVLENISSFFNNVGQDKIDYLAAFSNALFTNSFYVLLIWVLGISIIGVIIIIPVVYFKSFVLGFTISTLIIKFGFKGILIAFLYVFPHLLFNILIYIYLSHFAIVLSSRIFKSFINKKVIDFKFIFKKYFIVLLISLLVIIITALYESFIIPLIFRTFSGLISA